MVYQDPMTSHKMAVKFEVMVGARGGYRMSPLNNEDIILKQLWKRNSTLQHIPIYYGQYMLPENHLKMEFIDQTIEGYIEQLPAQDRPKKLVEVCLQMLGALREMH